MTINKASKREKSWVFYTYRGVMLGISVYNSVSVAQASIRIGQFVGPHLPRVGDYELGVCFQYTMQGAAFYADPFGYLTFVIASTASNAAIDAVLSKLEEAGYCVPVEVRDALEIVAQTACSSEIVMGKGRELGLKATRNTVGMLPDSLYDSATNKAREYAHHTFEALPLQTQQALSGQWCDMVLRLNAASGYSQEWLARNTPWPVQAYLNDLYRTLHRTSGSNQITDANETTKLTSFSANGIAAIIAGFAAGVAHNTTLSAVSSFRAARLDRFMENVLGVPPQMTLRMLAENVNLFPETNTSIPRSGFELYIRRANIKPPQISDGLMHYISMIRRPGCK